jgi:hypothetical protein
MAKADYLESQVSGTKYRRCRMVLIQNEKNQVPSMEGVEEEIVDIGGKILKTNVGSVRDVLTADTMGTSFPLVHPDTLDPLGATMTYMELSIAIQSWYHFVAERRDAELANQ